MCRVATTQSKCVGPNQNSICSVENSLLPYRGDSVKRIKIITKPWMQKEEDWNATNTLRYGTVGRMTKFSENPCWYTDGLTSGSSTSTTFPRSTFVSNAPHRQRLRYESTVHMRGVDSNKQAGPLCQRPDYKSSANALVSLQWAQGEEVPHIAIQERTRQDNTLDPAVQQHLQWLSFNWPTYFSSSSSSISKDNSTWWSSSSWDHKWQDWHSGMWQTIGEADLSHSSHTISDNIVMWENRHSSADWVCFKTQTLLVILRTRNQPQEECCIFFWK